PSEGSPQPGGELINKDKGKKAMSSKDAEEEDTGSDCDEDANLTGSMVESSKKKKLEIFDFFPKGGDHIHLTAEQIKEQKRIKEPFIADLAKQEVELGKDELVDLLCMEVVTCFYKSKLQYDHYCDRMLNRRGQLKIINCDVLTRKGLITLNVYREDETSEIITNFKASDLHLKLEIEYNKPLSEQDPILKPDDLARKKRKRFDDIHDYFRILLLLKGDFSNEMLYTVQEIFFRLHQGPGLDDHARTFSSFLLAKVDKRNLNPLKQMRSIEQLRQ
nr:hypothetical protein [Tanacetum cinerariifolium]GEU93750.1 hypothetical protein [Tanacetum cinerariifolium]